MLCDLTIFLNHTLGKINWKHKYNILPSKKMGTLTFVGQKVCSIHLQYFGKVLIYYTVLDVQLCIKSTYVEVYSVYVIYMSRDTRKPTMWLCI